MGIRVLSLGMRLAKHTLTGMRILAISANPCHKCSSPCTQRRELEYNKFLRDKMVVAKNEFRALLRETKKITYRLVEPLPHCITQSHSHDYFLGMVWEYDSCAGGYASCDLHPTADLMN